jgi:hypothetical protein
VTISVADRKAAMQRVLVRLAELCGDYRRLRFGPADLVPANPLPTTLAELEEAHLVKLVVFESGPEPYALTDEGWFQAQRAAGHFDSAAFNDRRARVRAAMKRAVVGRRDDALLRWDELASTSEVPEGWLWNILKCGVLHRLDRKRRYWMRFEDGVLHVPATFGQEPVVDL